MSQKGTFFDGFGRDVLPILRIGGFHRLWLEGRRAKAPLQGLRKGFPGQHGDRFLIVEAGSGETQEAHRDDHRRHEAPDDHGRPFHLVQDGLHLEDENLQSRRRDSDGVGAFRGCLDRREAHLR